MAFIRNSHKFTSEQSAAIESIAKAFSNETHRNRSCEYGSDCKFSELCVNNSTYRTRPCAYGPNCKFGELCKYANDSSKLIPIKCKYDLKCYNDSCQRFHTGQTMEEYISVNQFTWPEKEEKSVESFKDSFVIQIDEPKNAVSLEDSIGIDIINREMDEVCDEIDIITHKKEFLEEVERLGVDEFDQFIEKVEIFNIYKKTLKLVAEEYQYARFIFDYISNISK